MLAEKASVVAQPHHTALKTSGAGFWQAAEWQSPELAVMSMKRVVENVIE